MKNKIKSKSGEKFGLGMLIILLSMSISLFAFLTQDKNLVGLAASNLDSGSSKAENNFDSLSDNDLREFKDVNSLATLAAGNYFIDSDGIVYWFDDESKPAVAKVNSLDESQKRKQIYIDDGGRIGYVLSSVSAK